jgi:hypothetical protein
MYRFGPRAGVEVKILVLRPNKVTVREQINRVYYAMASITTGNLLECIYHICAKSSCKNVQKLSTWAFLAPTYHFVV